MSYQSPIEVYQAEPIMKTIKSEMDEIVVRAVQKVSVNVDKDELVKALAYDRGQYEKGYADGKQDAATTSETPNCYCQKYYKVTLADKVIGYGKEFQFVADYKNSRFLLYIPIACDSDDVQSVKIKYCPFCGRKLSDRSGDTECG